MENDSLVVGAYLEEGGWVGYHHSFNDTLKSVMENLINGVVVITRDTVNPREVQRLFLHDPFKNKVDIWLSEQDNNVMDSIFDEATDWVGYSDIPEQWRLRKVYELDLKQYNKDNMPDYEALWEYILSVQDGHMAQPPKLQSTRSKEELKLIRRICSKLESENSGVLN